MYPPGRSSHQLAGEELMGSRINSNGSSNGSVHGHTRGKYVTEANPFGQPQIKKWCKAKLEDGRTCDKAIGRRRLQFDYCPKHQIIADKKKQEEGSNGGDQERAILEVR